MTRCTTLVLSLSLLSGVVQASNPLFGAYGTAQCDACLDETYQSCPGDYETRPYAECICKGDGGTNFVSCLPYCDGGIDEAGIATRAWYRYCVQFFKDICPAAQAELDEDEFNEECSEKAIAAGGIGEEGEEEGEEGKSAANTETGANPTKTAESSSEETSDDSEAAESTSGAIPTTIPAWAVVAGLGLQFIHI
ncbi:hypothetical protein F66182_1320 [Fusarium sp. NRRL 66182]|nr:hypothetical protein F66182_1320 [Fusarium sp. NRRL 66182]